MTIPSDIQTTEIIRRSVPKAFGENVRYRRAVLKRCKNDLKFRKSVVQACKDDVLFYVNTMAWTYDPRRKPTEVPFITYPFQDEVLSEMAECIGERDLLVLKARDMGVSWMTVVLYQHQWQFFDMLSFTLMSRKEDLVDRSGDPDSLFWKFDFIIDHLPGWMRCPMDRNKMHRFNQKTQSVVNGESTTSESTVGGRRTGLMLDEFALVKDSYGIRRGTADVTNSRFFVSTPAGIGNAFYDIATDGECRKIELPWWLHPEKSRGLYTSTEKGRLQVLDTSYPFSGKYEFITDGKKRSPWFDEECKRRPPAEIASQLECDFLGSDSPYFPSELLRSVMENDCRAPDMIGDLRYDVECQPIDFAHGRSGGLRLWIRMGSDGKPPRDYHYCIGCDIGAGTGATNSVASIGCSETGEKIGEMACAKMRPHEFAEYVIALCRWFKGSDGVGAYLCWEDNGQGAGFGQRVLDIGYGNLYYRAEDEQTRVRLTKKAGWYTGPKGSHCSKAVLAGEYLRSLNTGEFIQRSRLAIQEAEQYKYFKDGSVGHGKEVVSVDPSGARENHSDRVMADMLLSRIMPKRQAARSKPEPEYPPHSMGWSLQQRGVLDRIKQSDRFAWGSGGTGLNWG